MTRVYHTFEVENINLIKQQMLNWASRFSICCFLDNQQYQSGYNSFECLLGVGSLSLFEPAEDFFSSLSLFISSNHDWILGHFNYEIRNTIEEASLFKNRETGFPACFLFVPELVIILNANKLTIGVINHNASLIFSDILKEAVIAHASHAIEFKQRISREEYLNSIRNLKKHIKHGDCYEINFCQEFYATAEISPASVYSQLINISPNPFSAFYRISDNYLLCASPERYLKKVGDKIISQPIKGTSARNSTSSFEDKVSKKQLRESAKDKAENVMIVDLVRNDLSKICEEGTVTVEELFGVYSFPHVHQMISTVTGILKKEKNFSDVLKATFPMGSMTGAPKKKVMELIEKYEHGKRGIYSGTVGYFTPEKDFDFNVVIRSIVYNGQTQYLSFHTGSAITASSQPEIEYDECLLKGKAIVSVFSENAKG
ncbi:MAG: anthranilate synthase component family protein [Segetibacter sp.]|nr:anthranilate synthase component family protein [Segetibacter sp.]